MLCDRYSRSKLFEFLEGLKTQGSLNFFIETATLFSSSDRIKFNTTLYIALDKNIRFNMVSQARCTDFKVATYTPYH